MRLKNLKKLSGFVIMNMTLNSPVGDDKAVVYTSMTRAKKALDKMGRSDFEVCAVRDVCEISYIYADKLRKIIVPVGEGIGKNEALKIAKANLRENISRSKAELDYLKRSLARESSAIKKYQKLLNRLSAQ